MYSSNTWFLHQRFVLYVVPTMITTHPHSVNVSIGESVILSCKATGSDPIRYQWSRVNGEISSNSKGVNTSNLTISSVTEQDEDEYYCIASNGGSNGLLYEETSNKAMVMVYGELHYILMNLLVKLCFAYIAVLLHITKS